MKKVHAVRFRKLTKDYQRKHLRILNTGFKVSSIRLSHCHSILSITWQYCLLNCIPEVQKTVVQDESCVLPVKPDRYLMLRLVGRRTSVTYSMHIYSHTHSPCPDETRHIIASDRYLPTIRIVQSSYARVWSLQFSVRIINI